MLLAENIKRIRTEKGISQRELARRINMSGQMISKIEKSETSPSIETLSKIAKTLDVSVNDLLDMEVGKLQKEGKGLESLESILKCVYDEVELQHHYTVDCDGIPEHDGDYHLYLRKGNDEIYLDKAEYEILFKFVCDNIPTFISIIEKNKDWKPMINL